MSGGERGLSQHANSLADRSRETNRNGIQRLSFPALWKRDGSERTKAETRSGFRKRSGNEGFRFPVRAHRRIEGNEGAALRGSIRAIRREVLASLLLDSTLLRKFAGPFRDCSR